MPSEFAGDHGAAGATPDRRHCRLGPPQGRRGHPTAAGRRWQEPRQPI